MANITIPEFLDKDILWDDADLIVGWGNSANQNIETTLALFRSFVQFTPVEITGTSSITSSGVYYYTGAGGHTITIANSLRYVSLFHAGSGALTVSGTINAAFAGTMYNGSPALIFRWASTEYIF